MDVSPRKLRPRRSARKKIEDLQKEIEDECKEEGKSRPETGASRKRKRTSSFEVYDTDEDQHGWSKGDKLRLIQGLLKYDSRDLLNLSMTTKRTVSELRSYFLRLQPSLGSVSTVYYSSPCLEEWEAMVNNLALKHQDYSTCISKLFNAIQKIEASPKRLPESETKQDPGVDWPSIYGFFSDALAEKPVRNLKLLESKIVLDVLEELKIFCDCFQASSCSETVQEAVRQIAKKTEYERQFSRKFRIPGRRVISEAKDVPFDSLNPLDLPEECLKLRNKKEIDEFLKDYRFGKYMELVKAWPYVYKLDLFKAIRRSSDKSYKLYKELDKTLQPTSKVNAKPKT
ncbi:DgyrCDS7439 [Dimorphilus gyrociliatus]|uniref:DgyrCDS7439 n=1 Tax=Dimorphilus gyrociliatus TaxID=2664684 RepID=A0A7I8VSQ9_9ANNE|nr:DgyrCDS7439 [Dimorphilus gyrociliatus]